MPDVRSCWYIDSGATDWICKDYSRFSEYHPFRSPRSIRLGDNSIVPSPGYGVVEIETKSSILRVSNVLYAPKMALNLASSSRMIEKGCSVNMTPNRCVISKNDTIIANATQSKALRLWQIDELVVDTSNQLITSFVNLAISREPVGYPQAPAGTLVLSATTPTTTPTIMNSVTKWHRKLSNAEYTKRIMNSLGITYNTDEAVICEPCTLAKQTEMINHKSATDRKTVPLQRIYIDTNGPWNMPSLHKRYTETVNPTLSLSKYILVIVDDATGYIWVRFYASRAEFKQELKNFMTMIRRQGSESNYKVYIIRIDNAKEFVSEDTQQLCLEEGIEVETSAPYAHNQNGVAERANRTLRDMAGTALIELGLPEAF